MAFLGKSPNFNHSTQYSIFYSKILDSRQGKSNSFVYLVFLAVIKKHINIIAHVLKDCINVNPILKGHSHEQIV
jgi:hypothetical protein